MAEPGATPHDLKIHLDKIKDALENGYAAVMVGAGFSRNAINGDRMPQWRELAQKLDLSPSSVSPVGTSDMLRLAEEYRAVHGQIALNAFIQEHLPDEGVTEPGELHKQLLALNWSDVFTTNYDTLLERAQALDQQSISPTIKGRYRVVRITNEIPLSKKDDRRRIIKLHGSFQSNPPFILTEEDFRTYPQKFAPFVNTVQQSMLENIFCLIGFSGDDPNFLQWMGWVHDKLGDNQPKIYLIQFNPSTAGQAALYPCRNIIPLNISALLSEEDRRVDKYKQKATEKFFEYLSFSSSAQKPWLYYPSYTETPTKKKKRTSYPGWLFPPLNVITNFWQIHKDAHSIPEVGQKIDMPKHADQSLIHNFLNIYEDMWATQKFYYPLNETLLEHTKTTLTKVKHLLTDPQKLTPLLNQLEGDLQEPQENINTFWQEIACTLLAHYRTRDTDQYLFWKETIKSLRTDLLKPNTLNCIAYNDILHALENFNPNTAKQLLEEWEIEGGDIYWPTRKAMLWAELVEKEKADTELVASLQSIRMAIKVEGETPALLSREQWTEVFLESIRTWNFSPEGTKEQSIERKSELRNEPYHPWNIIIELCKSLNRADTLTVREERVSFDMGSIREGRGFRSEFYPGVQEYSLFLGCVEQTAMGPRLLRTRFNPKTWISCASLLLRRELDYSHRLLGLALRASFMDLTEDSCVVFSRFSLHLMPEETANQLVKQLSDRIEELNPPTQKNAVSSDQLRNTHLLFAIELLGRISVRLAQEPRKDLLEKALGWAKDERFFTGEHDQVKTFYTCLMRLMDNVDPQEYENILLKIFSLPPVSEHMRKSILNGSSDYIGRVMPLPFQAPENKKTADWDNIAQNIFNQLIQEEENLIIPTPNPFRAANTDNDAINNIVNEFNRNQIPLERKEISDVIIFQYWNLLLWLVRNKMLSEKTIKLISNHIWKNISDTNLPAIPGHRSWAALYIITSNDEQNLWVQYKKSVLSNSPKKDKSTYFMNYLAMSHSLRLKFTWTKNEIVSLLKELREIELPDPQPDTVTIFLGRQYDTSLSDLRWLVSNLCGEFLSELHEERPWLIEWLDKLIAACKANKTSSFHFELCKLMLLPEDERNKQKIIIAKEIKASLFLNEEQIITNGDAFLFWKYALNTHLPVPEEASHALTEAFCYQQPPRSVAIANVLCDFLELFDAGFDDEEKEQVLQALERHLPVLSYENVFPDEHPGVMPEDKPLPLTLPHQRLQFAQLIQLICTRHPELNGEKAVIDWLESIKNDPMADVQNIYRTLLLEGKLAAP